MKNVFLGVDIGTTNIKLVVTKADLMPLYEKSYDYNYDILPNGWLEIAPTRWTEIIFKGIDELQQVFPCQILAIAVTGQMHTTVFLDEKMHSIRPAILWNDMRTKQLLSEIKSILLEKTESPQLANVVSNGSPLANLYWLKQVEPEKFSKLHRVMMPVNYINLELCGQESMDYCDATTTSLYDLEKHDWAYSVFDAFGLDENLFPPLRAASEIIGFLKDDLLERWKQAKPVAIVTGTGDNVAAALATGSLDTGQPFLSLGTSGVAVIPDCYPNLKSVGKNVLAEIVPNDGLMITQGTVQAGAKINSWWIEKIMNQSDFLAAQNEISIANLGRNSTIFIPHMNGEKTLFANPDLRGAFLGLSLDTDSSEMYQAILEGLAFGLKMVIEEMLNLDNVSALTIVGGGAKSSLWLKMFANIFNKPICKGDSSSDAVYGAIRLAMISQGEKSIAKKSQSLYILPDQKLVSLYEKQYKKYQQGVRSIQYFTTV